MKAKEHIKKFNETFNKTSSPRLLKHRYPTRIQIDNLPCEKLNQHTMHKDIYLERNEITGRKSALNGFLQHAYSVWDPKK